eukprot:s3378_g8.t1
MAFESSAAQKWFSRVLKPSRQWFKIAGGAKARVVEEALQLAPKMGACLEIGTYVGFTAIRFAASRFAGLVALPRCQADAGGSLC